MAKYTVSYLFPTSHRFRVPFHNQLREKLAAAGVEYRYIYSNEDHAAKADTDEISWAINVPNTRLRFGKRSVAFQHAFKAIRKSDLIIVQQENALLINYALQLRYLFGGAKVAFFGHGKNFQSSAPDGLTERWKRFWSTKVHWWFAYTQQSAQIVEQAGFPTDRITVFNNAIDTGEIHREIESVSDEQVEALRRELGISSPNVGIFIGGMYAQKRLAFLVEAALLIRKSVPDFHMLLLGAGSDAPIAQGAASAHDFIHYLGPKFGREKTMLAMMSKVFLMPGLVGLAVLDSFAYGLPMITTNVPYHSPEIAYLDNETNGIITPDPDDLESYAGAVIGLLQDNKRLQTLRTGALKSSKNYSIEAMVERFATGVLAALEKERG